MIFAVSLAVLLWLLGGFVAVKASKAQGLRAKMILTIIWPFFVSYVIAGNVFRSWQVTMGVEGCREQPTTLCKPIGARHRIGTRLKRRASAAVMRLSARGLHDRRSVRT